MGKTIEGLTRRDFIKGVGVAAVGSAVGLPAVAREARATQSTSRVVLIRHRDVVTSGGRLNAELVHGMVNDAMVALFGLETPSECWKLIIKPNDIVGIKTNVWRYLPTPSDVVDAIRQGLHAAGVSDDRIGIGDRNVRRQSIFRRTTALINSRPMRTHAWSGVGSLIKNYIMFYDHPPDYHADACADLAKLWQLPIVKGKTRLNILVMLTPQYHNIGPHHFDSAYVWPYRGLIVSTDPVAADAVGLRIIQQQRRRAFGAERPLRPTAHHIALADTEHHLGNADMSRIDLVRLGWEEDALI
jgi:hypothetical protein